MQYDLTRLNNNIDKFIPIDLTYSFSKEELEGTDLIKLDDVRITGEIRKNSLGNIELNVTIDGIMVLPCAITLKPVDYPFNIDVDGEINELMEDFSTNFQNSIDILPIIWENILMEIPMRVVSPDLNESDYNQQGDGWSFTTKEEENKSPLSELMDYIDDREVR